MDAYYFLKMKHILLQVDIISTGRYYDDVDIIQWNTLFSTCYIQAMSTRQFLRQMSPSSMFVYILGMRALQFSSEYSNEDLRNLQDCDVPRLDVLNTANLCPAISVVGLFYLFYLLTVIMNFVCRCIFRLDFTRRFRCCMCVSGE